jgi:hypothetical protein
MNGEAAPVANEAPERKARGAEGGDSYLTVPGQ